uniref:PX domain-containing protein n=1 Tax=Mastacembelus armatus TaxID=205130 RepID=A0A3Q3L5I9_9TELE
ILQEEVKETSALSVHGHNIKMTFCLCRMCQLSGTGEYHVDRTYDDFEWLQQHLFSQEDVPGIQGVIVSPLLHLPSTFYLTCKLRLDRHGSCFLGLGEWQPHCKALETFLRQVASHGILSKNKAVEIFLTSSDVSRISLTCFSNPLFYDYPHVAENNVNTLGLGLDLESRYQEAEKEMLFRRTCKLVEVETARRNTEKAKPVKKAMEEVQKTAEMEFDHICEVAKQEVKHLI